MNRKIAKYISAGLCISILTCSAPFVPLAFAEQTTASNEIPIIKAKNGEDEAADIKARTAAILHPPERDGSVYYSVRPCVYPQGYDPDGGIDAGNQLKEDEKGDARTADIKGESDRQ